MTCALGMTIPFLGKQFVLILPMVGITIQMMIALAIIYLNLEIYWWYLSGFILGLLGNPGIIDFVIALIIVDLTTVNNRSLWFVRFYALRNILAGLITFSIYCFVQHYGYIGLFWFALILQLISIGVIIRYFDLTLYNHTNMKIKNRFNLNLDIFIIFYGNRRTTQQKIGVLLTLIAYGFYALANSVIAAFFIALTTYPICWSSMLINIYKLVMSICLGIFSIIGYHILARLTKANDILICAISNTFLLITHVWTAFAQHNWQVFSNSIFYSFANYQNPLTLSILAKWLKPTEINIAFIFIFVINQLITSFGDYFFKWIFMNTTYQHKNIILFVSGGFGLITLILSICLYVVKYRLSNTSSSSSSVVGETTALLTNVDNNNPDSSESQPVNNSSPVPVRLFTIGNLTFSVTVGAPSKFKQRLATNIETIQGETTTEDNQNLINL
ncbi:unnamed protein product [Rotaria sp. Silwood1]|nr:unnamed protein product [Rotaria sp. Silwood1]CAF1611838.1 unnamed protein product [Rotaria sp. Silwood1]CAF3736691.1 unnamed protein product [Rotaria sp. Silwood1]CAF4714823.1 unnamed protein product [Rotaria sp. Silwood1]CAF4914757.1 unnamed protein product [Rotaria sp. Silwood1]